MKPERIFYSHNEPEILLQGLVKGDERALAYIIRHYSKSLYFFSESILKENTHSEDIVQEAFLRLWNNRKDFPSLLAVRGYLYQIVKNLSLDYLKHDLVEKKHVDGIALEITEDFLNEKMIKEELLGELYRAIDELPPDRVRIFKMYLAGKSNQEIADELKISIHTVKTQKQRVLIALKKKFGAEMVLLLLAVHGLLS